MFLHLSADDNSSGFVEVSFVNGNLLAKCHFVNGFIDNDIKQTLSSGLTSNLNFHLKLQKNKEKVLRSKVEEVLIRYDIWEKKYLVFEPDGVKQFSDYTKFESFLYDSITINFGSVRGTPQEDLLQVVLLFSPEKISSAQKKKLNYWLTSESDTEESNPALESESGFSVDLSKLFSIFLSKKTSIKIREYHSPVFSLKSLRENENASK